MKLEDFNSIDFKNMGGLPLPVKAVILGFLAIMIVGCWILVSLGTRRWKS